MKVIFSKQAKEVYDYLQEKSSLTKTENMILDAINNKIEMIKINRHYGNHIAKRLIPREYKIRYNIKNLFRVELPSYWRMLYSLNNRNDQIEIIAFVLDILDHKEYNKKFRYRNK